MESEARKNVRLRQGTKPKFMLMGSCQNLAHYLLVCSLTRSVGNLIIHCSSLSENMKFKMFHLLLLFIYFFLVEYQERNGIYPICLWAYSQDSNGKKNPLLPLKSIMCGVQLKEKKNLIDGLWSVFKGIFICFHIMGKSHTQNDLITLEKNIIELIYQMLYY